MASPVKNVVFRKKSWLENIKAGMKTSNSPLFPIEKLPNLNFLKFYST